MSILGWDPGDPNNWYQSPQLGLFSVRPAGYGGGISGACYLTHSSHPHGSPSYPPPQFSLQPSYPPPPSFPFQPSYSPPPPPPPPPSQTIINGYVFPHQFPCVPQTHSQFFPPPYLQPIHPITPQPLTTTPQSPSIPTYHSPHPTSNVWIHPSIPNFQSPAAPTFVPQTHNNEDTTNPSSPPPISDVSVQKEVLRSEAALSSLIEKLETLCQPPSVIGTEEVSFASLGRNPDEECRRDDAVVPKGTTNGVNLASTPELYPELVSLNTVLSNLNLLSHDSLDIHLMRDNKDDEIAQVDDEDREREQNVECSQVDEMSVHVSSSNGEHEATGFVGDIPLDIPAVAVKPDFVLKEGLKLDNKMAVCSIDTQSRLHLLSWFILFFELGNCETSKETPPYCRKASAEISQVTQTLVFQVFTTIISSPQYFRASFYGVLYDLIKLYVVIYIAFIDNARNLLPDDSFGIMIRNGKLFYESMNVLAKMLLRNVSKKRLMSSTVSIMDTIVAALCGESIKMDQQFGTMIVAAIDKAGQKAKKKQVEDIIVVGMTAKLNTVSNSMGISTGNREPEIQNTEGVSSVMWKNNAQSHHFQDTNFGNGSSVGNLILYSEVHTSMEVDNGFLNGNFLFLPLENMSLLLADKWEIRDKIVKMMFVNNWERWNSLVIAANKNGTEDLHVNFLENHKKLDQKSLGYVPSNLDAPYNCIGRGSSLVQYISDLGFLENNTEWSPCRYENVISASQSYISQNDIVVGFLLLNLSMWLQLFSQIIIHDETTSATFLCVIAVNCDPLSEQPDFYPKSSCELERAINWKKGQGYQVVFGIAALKLYLFYVFTFWSRIMVGMVFAILLSRMSLIKHQYAWLQFLLGGSAAPMSTDDIDNSNLREFLASTLLLNNVERDENLIAALASFLGKDCSGCIKNGELDQSCKKIYLCHDQFKAFVMSNLYGKWFWLSIICVQGLTLLLTIILKALGLHHYFDSDDDYILERVSLPNYSPFCVFGNTTYESRIMKYLKELAQIFDFKSQMETLVDYQVSLPQKKICSSFMVDFILLPFTSSFGSLHLQLDAKRGKTSQHSPTLYNIAEIHVKNLKVPATHKYFNLCLMKIYEESCINGSVTKTKEKQLKAMVIDTTWGNDLDDEAGRPAKVLTDIDQASQAWLFVWKTYSLATFLTLGALLISVTHAMSTIAASFVQLGIEVNRYINDQPLTGIDKITGMSH